MVIGETRLRVLTLGITAMLVVGACGSSSTSSPSAAAPSTGASTAPSTAASTAPTGPQKGGTLVLLSAALQFDQVDPQRAYTGEDLAFFDGTIYRSLEQFTFSSDDPTASKLSPDLATDTGTASADAKTWTFTLRDGVTFQDGSPITCADVAYGVSRTFATDVINQGPTYQIQYLDIPTDPKDGSSMYKGPYKKTGQDLFDKAVTCSADQKTITFHLNQPVGNFNYATTLGMSPVPKAADTGESYAVGKPPMASGPYMVQSYVPGNGGKMILVRNPKWNAASDPYHHAYPDKWEVDFGIDAKVLDQRLIASTGNDQYAMEYGGIQPENLSVVFKDSKTPNDQFKDRAISAPDIYVRYYWIDTKKVPNVKIRQAMAVALDRQAVRKNSGGDFFGDYADGLIKPNLGADYAPTNLWTSLLGQPVPDNGDPAFAKKLIADSGVPAPSLTYDYAQTPTGDKNAAIVKASLELAGFKISVNPIERGKYYSVVFGKSAHDFGYAGWGADYPSASTVIAPLLTVVGGWDLSRLDDPDYNKQVTAALGETDPAKNHAAWQALNTLASKNMYTIPAFFELTQRLAGTKVGGIYLWGPYGSWPYGDMYVKS
jgi:peptide/nickel transport system substrate-binding protein